MKRLIFTLIALCLPAAAQAQWSTLDSLKAAVLYRLDQTDNRRYSDSSLTDFINEAQIRVAIDCGAYRKKDTVTTDVDQAFYTANADAIEGWPIEVLGYNPEYSQPTFWGLVYSRISNWFETGASREKMYSGYVHAGEIVVNPAPSDSGGSLYIYYRAWPPPLSDSADTTQIPAPDRPGIIHYAAFLAAGAAWPERAPAELAEYQRHRDERQRDMVGLGAPVPQPQVTEP